MSGLELIEAPPYRRGEHLQVWELASICPQADRQLIEVGEDPDTQRQVSRKRDNGKGLEHEAAHQIERTAGPGDIGHYEIDEGLVVDDLADARDDRFGQMLGQIGRAHV